MNIDSTLETTTEEKVVNFLDLRQKKYDWRYESHHSLGDFEKKTIYWIATALLMDVSEKNDWYHLYYYRHTSLIKDGERNRHKDGAPTGGINEYSFNLREVKEEMMKAKHEGCLFYSIFVEETVSGSGLHNVQLLYSNNPGEPVMYGIPSFTPWYKMPVDQFIDMTHFTLNDEVERILLLGQQPYRWLK